MDSATLGAILTSISALTVGALAFIGSRRTEERAARDRKRAQEFDEKRVQVEQALALLDQVQEERNRLDRKIEAMRAEHRRALAEEKRRCDEKLAREGEVRRREVARLEAKIELLQERG